MKKLCLDRYPSFSLGGWISVCLLREAIYASACTQWGLASMTLQVQQVHPPPSMPPHTVHTERSGANCSSVFTSKHVSVKAGKGCLLCSIVQKGTHKCNIKRHYDTVLYSKSAADAANLSIFTLRLVNCGSRVTSSWGNIEYMLADAWYNVPVCTYVTVHSPTLPSLHLRHSSFSNLLSFLLCHRLFTYVTWRAANGQDRSFWSSLKSFVLSYCIPTISHRKWPW